MLCVISDNNAKLFNLTVCDTDPPCNFTEEILLNQAGCKPCVCKTDVMCQPCIRPLTDCCHCMCVDPTEPRPEIDDTEDPPPSTWVNPENIAL